MLVQELQQKQRIAAAVFLSTGFRVTDFGRVPDATRHPEVFHQPEKPAYRSGRFNPDDDGGGRAA